MCCHVQLCVLIFSHHKCAFLAAYTYKRIAWRHKQYACTQTQGVNGYQLVITCLFSKGCQIYHLFSYRPMVFLRGNWEQVECKFVNKLSIYFLFVNQPFPSSKYEEWRTSRWHNYLMGWSSLKISHPCSRKLKILVSLSYDLGPL